MGEKGVVLVLDEADAMWSSSFPGTQREQNMYQILGADFEQDDTMSHAILKRSQIRSFVQISATHISTVLWHYCFSIPFRKLIADEDRLRSNGFVLYQDLENYSPHLTGTTEANSYGLKSEVGKKFIKSFAEMKEPRNPWTGEERSHWGNLALSQRYQDSSGKIQTRYFPSDSPSPHAKYCRMMLLCLTPKIAAARGLNTYEIAEQVLQEIPDALILIREAQGSFFLSRETREPYKIVDSKGKKEKLGPSIEYIDKEYGMIRPLVVLGYGCLKRCISVRSPHRVITHAMFNVSKSSIAGNVQQMFMRVAGMTKVARKLNGFGEKVKVLCTEEDYKLVQELYKFTQRVLECSSGSVDNLGQFLQPGNYDQETLLFITSKPLVKKGDWEQTLSNLHGRPNRQRGITGEVFTVLDISFPQLCDRISSQPNLQVSAFGVRTHLAEDEDIEILNWPIVFQMSANDWSELGTKLFTTRKGLRLTADDQKLLKTYLAGHEFPWADDSLGADTSGSFYHAIKNVPNYRQRFRQSIRTRGGKSAHFRASSVDFMVLDSCERKVLAVVWNRRACVSQQKLHAMDLRRYGQAGSVEVGPGTSINERVKPVAWWKPKWYNMRDVRDDELAFTLSIDLPVGVTWEKGDQSQTVTVLASE